MISKGSKSKEPYQDLSNISQADIAAYYLNIKSIPSLIHSPLRQDTKPSFALYCPKGTEVNYRDFGTGESGTIWTLLTKMWNCSIADAVAKVHNDLGDKSYDTKVGVSSFETRHCRINTQIDLQCKVREWRDYDLEYWGSYGISLKWLKYADVYPISHKIVIKNGISYIFGADKYAYAYVEFKEGKVTLKIYQPFNKQGYKWSSNIDKSVWSLWTKIPKRGDNLIISSSVKDCLNIMCNLKIPSICLQGEGYLPKPQVIETLKSRYKNIIVFFDNDFNNSDNPGHKDAERLCKEYAFRMVEIPKEYESKDPSDLFKNHGKKIYLKVMNKLLENVLWKCGKV